MKTIITSFLCIGAIGCFSSCTTVEQAPPTTTTTTTTDQTAVSQPYTSTLETRTTRTY